MDIAALSKQIAENKKGMMEATTLRKEESEANFQTVNEAQEGLASVLKAIDILEGFYGVKLLQTGKSVAFQTRHHKYFPFVPTNSDRSGLTVADRAPEVFDEKYQGETEASKGILGTLQVIAEDFQRTLDTTETAEAHAVTEFGTFSTKNSEDTGAKETSKGQKKNSLTVAN